MHNKEKLKNLLKDHHYKSNDSQEITNSDAEEHIKVLTEYLQLLLDTKNKNENISNLSKNNSNVLI